MMSIYDDPEPLDRAVAEERLASADPDVVTETLVSMSLHATDWRWVQAQCAEAASHPALQVRSIVPICFGHLARIHGTIDWNVVEPVLARLGTEPRLAGQVESARDDFEVFLGRRGRNDLGRVG